jgi:hypothetical protein
MSNFYYQITDLYDRFCPDPEDKRIVAATNWINETINRRIPPGVWVWLWIWYILLTIMLYCYVIGDIFKERPKTIADIYYIHDGSTIEQPSFEHCLSKSSSYDDCLRWFISQETTTSTHGIDCAVQVDHIDICELLNSIGADPKRFSLQELENYARHYIWCFSEGLCTEQIHAAQLQASLKQGCSFPKNSTLRVEDFPTYYHPSGQAIIMSSL